MIALFGASGSRTDGYDTNPVLGLKTYNNPRARANLASHKLRARLRLRFRSVLRSCEGRRRKVAYSIRETKIDMPCDLIQFGGVEMSSPKEGFTPTLGQFCSCGNKQLTKAMRWPTAAQSER